LSLEPSRNWARQFFLLPVRKATRIQNFGVDLIVMKSLREQIAELDDPAITGKLSPEEFD
jgi:hypothetical protein